MHEINHTFWDQVTVSIPSHINYQNVYRQERLEPFEIVARHDVDFVFVDSLLSLCRQKHVRKMIKQFYGPKGYLKTIFKLLSGQRVFYGAICNNELSHYAWMTVGRCRYYWVAPREVTIGPIGTISQWQRRGIATFAAKNAINRMIQKGFSVFYIDTSNDNISAQKSFSKFGFGDPVGVYLKGYKK